MRCVSDAGISAVIVSIVLCIGCATEARERQIRPSQPARVAQPARIDRAEMQKPDIVIPRLEKKIHDLINAERKKRGLAALGWQESLNRIAQRYSQDMSRRNFFSHNDPEGNSFMDRYQEEGFACSLKIGNTTYLGAENIAQDNLYKSIQYHNGVPSYNWNTEDEIAASIVKGWMNSKAHRENILTPYFKRQGIGLAISGDGKVYVTQNFC
ncbi:MAG: CAP domain-containing protein [Nitrospirota bacterium]|nr:CAP domain-containing protein [Nitrospirota bacterium]